MHKKNIFYFSIGGLLLLRIWALEGFSINSLAMQPTLKSGDWIWINKLPFTQIQKNDIIAYRFPFERKVRQVKRCVGVSGDTIHDLKGKYAVLPSDIPAFVIPKKGQTIELNEQNFAFYQPLLQRYENVQAGLIGEQLFINNQKSHQYTFTQNYFYTAGDNPTDADDTQEGSIIPESCLIGKALVVWQ